MSCWPSSSVAATIVRGSTGPGRSGDRPQQRRAAWLGGVADQDARVAAGLRVDADDRLPVEVLGDVGDQAVLADDDHDVLRGEQEPGQVVAVDLRRAASRRDRRRRPRSAPPAAPSCRGCDLGEVAPALPEEEAAAGPGAVPGQQLVELACGGTPTHDPGRERQRSSAHASARRPELASRPVSTSGVIGELADLRQLAGELACSARARSTSAGRSR